MALVRAGIDHHVARLIANRSQLSHPGIRERDIHVGEQGNACRRADLPAAGLVAAADPEQVLGGIHGEYRDVAGGNAAVSQESPAPSIL